MKKLILSLAVVLLGSSVTFAQKSNVNKAKNKVLSETPDFAGAREAIDEALRNDETKDQTNTWYVGGLVGYKEAEALATKMMLNQPYDKEQMGKAVVTSYDRFVKADALSQIPDAKGKVSDKIRKDIKPRMADYYTNAAYLISYGAYQFEERDYANAYSTFMKWVAIPDLPMMQGDPKMQAKLQRDTTYWQIKYFAAISAANADMNAEAIRLLEELTNGLYETKTCYQLLYQKQFDAKDTVAYVATLKEGMQRFPAEPWFLQNLINYYVFSNQNDSALHYLDKAIEGDPTVAQYYFIKGNLIENQGRGEEAIPFFQKALEIDPKLADAEAGIGRVYYNKAIKLLDDVSSTNDDKVYNQALKDGRKLFEQSLPYFEKAAKMAPDETSHKQILRSLYYRLGMDKEYEAISQELGL